MKHLKFYISLVLLLLTSAGIYAQQSVKIYGKVIDAGSGVAVAGATITPGSGKSQVIITANDGSFSFTTDQMNDTLFVSHVGYEPQKVLTAKLSKSPLVISLQKEVKKLNEVVVNTGFQYIPKERATGSFDYIDNKTLNLQTGTNILDRLNGMANGVLFDNSKYTLPQKKLKLNVHGLSTINGP